MSADVPVSGRPAFSRVSECGAAVFCIRGTGCYVLLSCGLLLAVLCGPVYGLQSPAKVPEGGVPGIPEPAVPVQPVWKLRVGDSFDVRTVVARRTTMNAGTQAATTVETADQQIISYKMETLLPGGDAVFVVSIRRAQRTAEGAVTRNWRAGAAELNRLNGFSLRLKVDPEGNSELYPLDGHEPLLRKLSGGDEQYTRFLKDACPSEMWANWLGRPFWLPQRDMVRADAAERTIRHQEAIGPFGLLVFDSVLKPQQSPNGAGTMLSISCTPRFLPLLPPDSIAESTDLIKLPLSAVRIEEPVFTGTVLNDSLNSVNARPPFRVIETRLTLKGSVQVSTPDMPGQTPAEQAPRTAFELEQRNILEIVSFAFAENIRELPLRIPLPAAEPQ